MFFFFGALVLLSFSVYLIYTGTGYCSWETFDDGLRIGFGLLIFEITFDAIGDNIDGILRKNRVQTVEKMLKKRNKQK